ncbi:MAG TPA: COQ9 family protein [Brevundimonas sp.]|jgi:ubiquinone biosynthesis protein COQ9|uniref:COQ9 family protein n=1 Tax=Brevundimonas sp. TaxID=1871086 RepID=UPI002CB0B3E7|nr:COQ9 family protein [Brevundimonas sp.]HRH19615.1 COQ9 family protein [Brevundimonas sp.]
MTASAAKPDWADRTEQRLLDAAIPRAADLGITPALLKAAGEACGLSEGDVGLLLPNGPADLVALLSRRHDAKAMQTLAQLDAGTLKIREKIAQGLSARLEAAAADLEASRRAVGFLTLPPNLSLAGRLTWESADLIWRWAGDVATDENHYSKRAILSGILAPALTMRLFDGREPAEAFVAARIENVMAFEKWKAGLKVSEPLKAAAEALAKMRYR